MKTITVDEFMGFDPCDDWPEARIREIAGDKGEWGVADILALRGVPAEDRLWAVLREELIDAPVLHEFACRCAESALALGRNPDPRSLAAVAAKRRWLSGEAADDELSAAGAAAGTATWTAAGTAAWYAAWAAAWAAAGTAAGTAAWCAARAAAGTAAGTAAGCAARAAAWEAALRVLREMLGLAP